MKTNLVPAGSKPISEMKIGDCFISIATSDLFKGQRALYLKVDLNHFNPKYPNKPWADPHDYAVNLSSGHIRKFDKHFLVEPCPNACVNV